MIKNILVANHHLVKAGGTETYTYTIIEELLKRGYQVEYFTFKKGKFAKIMEDQLNIAFMSRKKYDLIIANHFTCVNYLFNRGYCIQTCHGVFPRKEQPSKFADSYVAISEEVKAHLQENGFESIIILNSLNVERFKIYNKIRDKLSTVLSLCHSKEANTVIAEACKRLDLQFIEQSKYEEPIWEVEQLINSADLVIGLGRSAYEAMACGRPVIVFDSRHYYHACGDGYVKEFLSESIKFNCSGRFKNKMYSAEDLVNEMNKYDPSDRAFFREFATEQLNIHHNIRKYLNLKTVHIKPKITWMSKCVRSLIGVWFSIFYYLKYPICR